MELSTFIIPLRKENDIWSFVHPFSFEVWALSLISIPIYILAWGMLNFLTSGHANWSHLVEFVLRNILVDHAVKMPDKTKHQKVLILGWLWFTFIIISAYAGNLIALITRPKLVMPIQEPADLLIQDKISWVMEDGIAKAEYMRGSPSGSTWRRIYDKIEFLDSEEFYSGCFTKSTQFSGRHASICDITSIRDLLHESFSKSGQCNWYLSENTFAEAPLVMIFQVDIAKTCFLL